MARQMIETEAQRLVREYILSQWGPIVDKDGGDENEQ